MTNNAKVRVVLHRSRQRAACGNPAWFMELIINNIGLYDYAMQDVRTCVKRAESLGLGWTVCEMDAERFDEEVSVPAK